MQTLIGGNVTSFETGVFDTVGIAHDEGLLLRLPPNRLIPTTGAVIFGWVHRGQRHQPALAHPGADGRSRQALSASAEIAAARPAFATRARCIRRLGRLTNCVSMTARPDSELSRASFASASSFFCASKIFSLQSQLPLVISAPKRTQAAFSLHPNNFRSNAR